MNEGRGINAGGTGDLEDGVRKRFRNLKGVIERSERWKT